MKFYQYFPNFCEGFDPEVKELANVDEALQTTTCRRWATDPAFKKFIMEPHDDRIMIRAVISDGTKWVVGFVK